ncbi:MAG: DUF6036 family nucleotidyltransferase [Gemmatimonadales bacterium]
MVIGGAAVNLLGFVSRATTDVDILAFGQANPHGPPRLSPPEEPLPRVLIDAARAVATDLNLGPNWLNAGPAAQWRPGLPPGLETRVHWREYGGLVVGLVDRYDLIFFKLYAAVDDTGPESVHFQDLLALTPTNEELIEASRWVRQQDPSPVVADTITRVINHARDLRDGPR